jgi:hypothetical protein
VQFPDRGTGTGHAICDDLTQLQDLLRVRDRSQTSVATRRASVTRWRRSQDQSLDPLTWPTWGGEAGAAGETDLRIALFIQRCR